MAHELYTNAAGRTSMAYVGEKPWHGLGQRLTPDASLDEWIVEAGFNWEVKRDLGLLEGSWERFKKDARELSKRTVSREEATRYFMNVFYKDEQEFDLEAKRPMLELVTRIYLEGIGQKVKTAKGTAWGLLNAVTRWADHERKAASRDTRMQSAWFGSAARIKDAALDEALALL